MDTSLDSPSAWESSLAVCPELAPKSRLKTLTRQKNIRLSAGLQPDEANADSSLSSAIVEFRSPICRIGCNPK